MSLLREDRFLGGRLTLCQPMDGFRAGLDAVMLAAAVAGAPAVAGGAALELGAGVGTVSLCLASRVAGVRIVGVEIDPALADIANANAAANGLSDRVSFVAGDALDLPADLRRQFDLVFCNPPFYGAGGEVSPVAAKARAKMDGGTLGQWLDAGIKRTRSGGGFTAIIGADRLGEALAVLPTGGVSVIPLWPKAAVPAKRIILRVRRGARSPLVLHRDDGSYTPAAEVILRAGAGLPNPLPI